MADIAGKKRIDNRTEAAYFRILKNPDTKPEIRTEIKKRITANHLPFVVSVANNFTARHSTKGELIDIGVTGLMRAIDSYDPASGNRFISYAVWWIRQSIIKHIFNDDDLIHVPQNELQKLARMQKQSDRTGMDIMDLCNTSKERFTVIDAMAASTTPLSMDLPVPSDKNEHGDLLMGDVISGPDLYDELESEDFTRPVESIVDLLSGIDREIISASYGIGRDQLTHKEIAGMVNRTSERVRQIKNKALRKLAAAAIKSARYKELTGLPLLDKPLSPRRKTQVSAA
jgi:RNA polymerase primary sigma factor